MKVFISWSDQTSKRVAAALGEWLPYVIQAVEPFVSSENIDKGERWSEELMKQLNDTSYGIICVTQHNLNAAWMNFEAGAISKKIDRSSVSPFLFGVGCTHFEGPLQQFQFTQYGNEEPFNKEEVFKLVSSMNNKLGPPQQVPHERLRRQLDMWWDELKKKLDEIANNQEVGNVAGLKWLLIPDDLLVIQRCYQFNSIWIITDNVFEYSLRPEIRETVQANMAKGIEYVYLIPKSKDHTDEVKEFLRICREAQSSDSSSGFCQPKVVPIADDEFKKSAPTHFIIVNPDNDDHSPLRMFLKLPVKATDPYWIEVDLRAAENFVVRFRALGKLTN